MTQPPQPGTAAGPDPWKSFRGVMAGTLILEAIVVLLALPVVASADAGLTPLTAWLSDRIRGGAGAAVRASRAGRGRSG